MTSATRAVAARSEISAGLDLAAVACIGQRALDGLVSQLRGNRVEEFVIGVGDEAAIGASSSYLRMLVVQAM